MRKKQIKIILVFFAISIILGSVFHLPLKAYTTKNIEKKSVDCLQNNNSKVEYYAVMVALSIYEDSEKNLPKPPLEPFPDRKLKRLYNALIQEPNWKKENIILLLNKDATKENIVNALINMSEKIDDNDVFLFTFQGHGSNIPDVDNDEEEFDKEDQYDETICPYDTGHNNTTVEYMITDDELKNLTSKIKTENITFIFDSCFSEGFANDLEQEGRIIITSSKPDSPSLGSFVFSSSLFYGFSMGIKHARDKNKDGFISVEEIYRFTKIVHKITNIHWNVILKIEKIFWKFILFTSSIFFKHCLAKRGYDSVKEYMEENWYNVYENHSRLGEFMLIILYIVEDKIGNEARIRDNHIGELKIIES